MRSKLFMITALIASMLSCEFRASVNKDLMTGLTTKGEGLSCDAVYLSDGEERIDRSSFTYGETFYLKFESIEGFADQSGYVFPGMQLSITGSNGDTVMYNEDLYGDYRDGMNLSPLLLQTNLTVGTPILSDNDYTLYVSIWDKKGDGTFAAALDFNVVANDEIKIENNHMAVEEVYLFSEKRKAVITGNKIAINENVYMIFEGLTGFQEEAGKVFPGISLKATDPKGDLILSEDDLVGETGMDASEFSYQVAPSFLFMAEDIESPVNCEVTIWDKNSEAKVIASIDLELE